MIAAEKRPVGWGGILIAIALLAVSSGCGDDSSSDDSSLGGTPATQAELIPACQGICDVANQCGWTAGKRPNCANACALTMVGLAMTVQGAQLTEDCYQSSQCDMICNTCGFQADCE